MTDESSRYEQGLAIRREVLVQAAVYCGMPAALDACRTAEAALEQHQRVG
jgi:alkylhydroperoxidase/carboxymuconolactone decarboxylase family protein YurZ